jgi:hypothetical protein
MSIPFCLLSVQDPRGKAPSPQKVQHLCRRKANWGQCLLLPYFCPSWGFLPRARKWVVRLVNGVEYQGVREEVLVTITTGTHPAAVRHRMEQMVVGAWGWRSRRGTMREGGSPAREGRSGLARHRLFFVWLVGWFFIFPIQGFLEKPWLSWNPLCRAGWPRTQKSARLCLLSAGVKGVRHMHA